MSASYDTGIRIAQELSTDEQRQLRAELDILIREKHVPRSTGRPFRHHIRPGLYDDLKEIERLADEVGEAWQGNQSAAEAVSEMRRQV